MKRVDLTFWIAVAALLLATWAVVRVESASKASAKRDAYILSRVVDNCAALSRGIGRAEERIESLWHNALYPNAGQLEEWPPATRTTSGDRPEVRGIEEGKP